MTGPQSRLARLVGRRAGGRCEFCLMHESLQGATLDSDHIVPRPCGGSSDLDNLAWCCPSCNLRKSDRRVAVDPETSGIAPLFQPRRDDGSTHFCWEGLTLVGLTAEGRATIAALDLNHPRRLQIRRAESLFGLFPP